MVVARFDQSFPPTSSFALVFGFSFWPEPHAQCLGLERAPHSERSDRLQSSRGMRRVGGCACRCSIDVAPMLYRCIADAPQLMAAEKRPQCAHFLKGALTDSPVRAAARWLMRMPMHHRFCTCDVSMHRRCIATHGRREQWHEYKGTPNDHNVFSHLCTVTPVCWGQLAAAEVVCICSYGHRWPSRP